MAPASVSMKLESNGEKMGKVRKMKDSLSTEGTEMHISDPLQNGICKRKPNMSGQINTA